MTSIRAFAAARRAGRLGGGGGASSPLAATLVLSAVAWAVALAAQLSGNAAVLHHHALIEEGPPLWVAALLFLVAWQVMVAAMMLPASAPAIRSVDARRAGIGLAGFLATYALAWSAFGLLAFLGDVALHHLVDTTPWLAARPWLIEASVLTLAGAYQFSPLKRAGLEACRHPAGIGRVADRPFATGADLGLRHGVDCVASSWALMLLMFAAGFANLWWMAALAMVMAYEAMGRHGRRAARVAGIGFLALAVVVLTTGRVPAFAAAG